MKLYKICNKISLLLHALCSAAGYFLIEAISRHSFTDAWTYMTGKPLVFAYNAGLIFTTSLIVYLFRRRTFWRVLVSIFWLLLGIINGVILANRVTPFTGPDLHLLTDGMAVLNKYLPSWGVVVALIVLGVLVLILLSLLIKGPKYQRKVKFRYDLLLVVVGIAAFVGITQLAPQIMQVIQYPVQRIIHLFRHLHLKIRTVLLTLLIRVKQTVRGIL